MFALLLVVIISILFSLFSTINTQLVSVHFGQFDLLNVPLYIVMLSALLLGVIIPSILYFIRSLSFSLTVSEKDNEILTLKKQLNESTKRTHILELENAKLSKSDNSRFDENSL